MEEPVKTLKSLEKHSGLSYKKEVATETNKLDDKT